MLSAENQHFSKNFTRPTEKVVEELNKRPKENEE
jgi:hypothetical protein